jgi:hypothetical protein
MSGVIFDVTGPYGTAFANGLAWSLSLLIAVFLLFRSPSEHNGRCSPRNARQQGMAACGTPEAASVRLD